ncbi:RNA polymerase II-associated protein 1 [Plodia interpunctella]|uniref:RNA polymerase II-associated protein 1 n=1 Tax=Plodia interpunctella TaxID=58824 RepID=UPI0023687281|nr:RNA polymerase II-associated protein 1 [Plodia interpunctella]
MFKRPKPGDDENEILRMQEEFLREKSKNQNLQPAAQVTNLRPTEATKRVTSDTRKPSKYAQSKGLKNHEEKRVNFEGNSSFDISAMVGDIIEKNNEEISDSKETLTDDDKVYYPKVIPSILGNIIEKNMGSFVDFDLPMPAQGFPEVLKRDPVLTPGKRPATVSKAAKIARKELPMMEVDESSPSTTQTNKEENLSEPKNLPTKSYILSSSESDDIHSENVNTLSKLSEKEILEEQKKLMSSLDPKLIEFIKGRRQKSSTEANTTSPIIALEIKSKIVEENMDTDESRNNLPIENDYLWENDILSHPGVNKWLHFDTFEKDKLQWMRGIEESKKIRPDEPYEARFNFNGYLLPYSMEYTEKTKTLFHHGEEPHRPGYTLSELFELSRSAVPQQRVLALNTIAGILEYYSTGTYKDILEIPLSKIFFVIRYAMDENKVLVLEPALKAMRNLVYNRIDEASLDALLGFGEGLQQPCLENDKSEIQDMESKESELKDFHLAEIDIIAALLRTDILQRLFYILETVKPSFNCVQYSLQILTRLVRDSIETATKIIDTDHLMQSIIRNFLPVSSLSFSFVPHIVYNGKPILAALKFLRILSLQCIEIGNILVEKYEILKPISEYISSGVDGTYGLRIQIEAYSILSNLLQYNLGIDKAMSLSPVIITTLYKHVKGTDIFVKAPVITATHAAVVLQFVNKVLGCYRVNRDPFKSQVYPLLKEGIQKWLAQLAHSESYTCGHLRLICSALDCCKTVLMIERVPLKFLSDSLKDLSASNGFKEVVNNLVPSSNLLSGIENRDLHYTKNLKCLGTSVIDSAQKVLPILNPCSPLPFLASLLDVLRLMEDKEACKYLMEHFSAYLRNMANQFPSLCDNWFTRIETDFLFSLVKIAVLNDISDLNKDLIYIVSSKLCYILRIDKKYELEFVFNTVIFNKNWFTTERLFNMLSLSDAENFSKAVTSIGDIKLCYRRVINLSYRDIGPNVVLRMWQEPILPRDWIYLPILMLYSKSQEAEETHRAGDTTATSQKELIITCSLEWILFNELCFSDLLQDMSITDRFCRVMCVFLCDNSLFLEANIKVLLQKCIQTLFKSRAGFDFDRELTGLQNFQDFYTQFLEQFQSVSYGDHTFAACVLVPLAQRHNVKWRKLVWSEYAGCLRALDCPEDLLCYEIKDYLYPEETDESLLRSYVHALNSNLLRPHTIAHRIAHHHVESFKKRTNSVNNDSNKQ